uniref:E3 ubiquitin-protein ligase CBL n=1 Tax=Eptatretus burgeri TaxID=7764 RepID=A0A8C4R764_EPTBU
MAEHIQSGKCSRALDTWNALQGVLQRVPSPTGTLQPRKAADRRAIERSRDRLAKALDACSEAGLQRPQGGTARSLRLPNVLLALYRLLSALAHRYRDCGHLLTDNLYLRVFLRNVDSKSRELVRLLTHERGAVLEERSPARRQLTRLSLVLSHIATELSAFFPHGVYEGESVEIRERDAAAFWTHAFDDRVIVPWKEFLEQISQCHQLDSKHEVIALQESMDLTCSGWVSVYDYDIFTRLFQPWSFALQSWKALMLSHPGYMAFLTYDEVRTRLQKYQSKPGSYVFRLSCSRPGQWAIGYVAKDGRIVQAVPPPTMPLHEVLQDGAKQGLYLYPDGRCKNVDLSSLCQHTRSSTSSPDEVFDSEAILWFYFSVRSIAS